MSMSEFYVVGYRERRVIEKLTSGNYSRLCADILFGRSMGYYIIQVGQAKSPNLESQVFRCDSISRRDMCQSVGRSGSLFKIRPKHHEIC